MERDQQEQNTRMSTSLARVVLIVIIVYFRLRATHQSHGVLVDHKSGGIGREGTRHRGSKPLKVAADIVAILSDQSPNALEGGAVASR